MTRSRIALLGAFALLVLPALHRSGPCEDTPQQQVSPAPLSGLSTSQPKTSQAKTVRVYSELLDPREHPDYARRHVKPPTWDTFGGRTQFTSIRGFEVQGDRIVRYVEEIEKYTRSHDLGDVIWPAYPILFAENLGDLAGEVARRQLYLFDVWGFVPGSGPGGYWQQFKPPPGGLALLEAKLGERWLGMDVGEQDGRYVGGYAPQMYPASAGRFQQYLNFQRHFQRMCDDLGNRMVALVSLNFGHYFLKEGVYTLLGAETAQGLPNGQVYYAFIRGAGKQYGVPWFGNASIFNRWGWKVYGSEGADGGYRFGPTKGTSLSLLKRLMYSHILYNCVLVGFENGWFVGGELSPIGRIQEAAHRWVKQNGQPGVMVCPIALLLDFFAGWSFPRHLYSGDVYRVWGNLPYEAGDHLTDGVLDLLYPGYQDASYFHDESGFTTQTPYGDSAECLLSDAPLWLLERYPILVVAGGLSGGTEIREKLEAYAAGGGRLVTTAGNLHALGGGLARVRLAGPASKLEAGRDIVIGGHTLTEERAFELLPLAFPAEAEVLASAGDSPAAVEAPWGKGSVTVLASPFGVSTEPPIIGGIASEVDRPLPKPYPLLKHVRAVLDTVFRDAPLFEVGSGLSHITCRKGPGEYTLGVANNSLRSIEFSIAARAGEIESIREIPLEASEKTAVGYLPEGFEKAEVGQSGPGTIAGGDVRIFSVRLRRDDVEPIPHVRPPPRRTGRLLFLRGVRSIQEEVLSRPTFFQHFDGVAVDWRHFRDRALEAMKTEGGWIRRQGLRVVADLSSGLNLYPDLRLAKNIREDYDASMAAISDVLEKLGLAGGRDLVLALHRFPENNFSAEETIASFDSSLREICQRASPLEVTVHLRLYPNRYPGSLQDGLQLISRVGASNLRLAPSTGMLVAAGTLPAELASTMKEKVGLWMLGTAAEDVTGRTWSVHGTLSGSSQTARLRELIGAAPEAPLVFDALYGSPDEEYRDAREVEGWGR